VIFHWWPISAKSLSRTNLCLAVFGHWMTKDRCKPDMARAFTPWRNVESHEESHQKPIVSKPLAIYEPFFEQSCFFWNHWWFMGEWDITNSHIGHLCQVIGDLSKINDNKNIWLVVYQPVWKKMDFVSWGYDIPNWMESHNPFMFQSTNQNIHWPKTKLERLNQLKSTTFGYQKPSEIEPWETSWNPPAEYQSFTHLKRLDLGLARFLVLTCSSGIFIIIVHSLKNAEHEKKQKPYNLWPALWGVTDNPLDWLTRAVHQLRSVGWLIVKQPWSFILIELHKETKAWNGLHKGTTPESKHLSIYYVSHHHHASFHRMKRCTTTWTVSMVNLRNPTLQKNRRHFICQKRQLRSNSTYTLL
jgi:hypothetical protein